MNFLYVPDRADDLDTGRELVKRSVRERPVINLHIRAAGKVGRRSSQLDLAGGESGERIIGTQGSFQTLERGFVSVGDKPDATVGIKLPVLQPRLRVQGQHAVPTAQASA